MNLENNYFRKFLLIDALFEGGRMFVGATSVTYLLSRGISMSDVAALKSLQAIVLIFGEIPTGVFADIFGRKLSLICGGISAIIGFLIYFFAESLFWFFLAESFTAISLCFWSGAFESCSIDYVNPEKSQGVMSRFFHLNNSINSLAVLTFGFLGGWIGAKGISIPYACAVISYIGMLFLLFSLPEKIVYDKKPVSKNNLFFNIKKHLSAAFKQGILHPALFPFFLVNIGIQFLIQPVLHYWQPFFSSIDSSIDSFSHGVIFSIYCGVTSVLSFSYSKLSYKNFVSKPLTISCLFVLFSLMYLMTGYQKNVVHAVICFAFLQAFLSLCRTSLSVNMNKEIESESRASILSSLSLFSRIGMVGALFTISGLLQERKMEIGDIYSLFGAISFVLVGFIILGILIKRRGNEK
jgi:MFS family permease